MVLEERKELLRSLELNLSKSKWVNNTQTNCYSYALGFDIPQYQILSYAPGMISGSPIKIFNKNYFTKAQLIYNMISDLEMLGIEYKKIDPSEKITSDKEWKIAVYLCPIKIDFGDGEPLYLDYHFLRSTNNLLWSHKQGFNNKPTYKDSNKKFIRNLDDCIIHDYQYEEAYKLILKR